MSEGRSADAVKAQGQAIMDALLKIKLLEEEKARLYDDLLGVAELMLQGIDPQQIERVAFCFKDVPKTGEFSLEVDRHMQSKGESPANKWITRVEMKDGAVVKLNPVLLRRGREVKQ